MISALALACITAAQPQTLTFTHACDQSSVVLEALGEELGMTLKPSGSVNKDYFFVGFKDVSAQVIFDKIAETLNAKWVRKGNVTYLTRSSDMDKAEVQAGKDLMREALPAMLDSDKPWSAEPTALTRRPTQSVRSSSTLLLSQETIKGDSGSCRHRPRTGC